MHPTSTWVSRQQRLRLECSAQFAFCVGAAASALCALVTRSACSPSSCYACTDLNCHLLRLPVLLAKPCILLLTLPLLFIIIIAALGAAVALALAVQGAQQQASATVISSP